VKKYLIILLTVCFLSSNIAFADVVELKQGEAAPFDGVLITQEKANELADKIKGGELCAEELVLVTGKLNLTLANFDDQNKMLDIYKENYDNVIKQYNKKNNSKVWYFVGGILVAIGSGIAIAYASKAID